MTLKNLGPGQVTNVMLQRAADINAGAGTDNVFLQSDDSVAMVNPSNGKGMMLGVLTPEISHDTFVRTSNAFSLTDFARCDAPPTPVPDTDRVGIIRFNLGTIAAGASRTVKLMYRRF
jgi:hypothetical protein